MRKNVLIIGGGFAGLRVARKLSTNSKNIDITLVNDSPNFRYCPALYRSATGFRFRESVIPIADITKNYKNFDFIQGKAKSIDHNIHTLTLENGQNLKYDIIVIALGVITSYFNISGLEKNSFNIKTPAGLNKLKDHLHETLTETGKPDTNYVVIGGGPTGVELSSALGNYLKIICKKHQIKHQKINIELIDGAKRILPMMNKKVSKLTARRLRKLKIKLILGKNVESETESSLKLADRKILSKTVIWTAGVTNNPFFKNNSNQFKLNDRGKVIVNEYMMSQPDLFVIGDNAGTAYGGLAQVAIRDANYTAKCILKMTDGRSIKPYKQLRPIYVVPAGNGWSILQFKQFVMSGKIPNIIREVADLIGYSDIMGLREGIKIWKKRDITEESCPKCQNQKK